MDYYDMPSGSYREIKGAVLPDPVAITDQIQAILEESKWTKWYMEDGKLVIPKNMNLPLVGSVDVTERGKAGDLLLLIHGEPKLLNAKSAAHWVPSEQMVLSLTQTSILTSIEGPIAWAKWPTH
jgi:hypothetical protein